MSKKEIDWKGNWEKTKKLAKSASVISGSVLNGAIGNHLENYQLGLSRELAFYWDGEPLALTKEILATVLKTPKVCILVHGLVSDETMWKWSEGDYDYGSFLSKDFGYSPLYLRYNSGRHISENGKDLASILDQLLKNSPTKIQEIIFVSHSMGGLVTRSACYYGEKSKAKWIPLVKKIFFIGSPHHGAPLEKFGNVVTTVLDKIPNPFTYLTKKAINLRSDGIKDLRYGFLVEEDWKGKDLDAFHLHEKTIVPLLPKTDYYVITGTISEDPNSYWTQFFGDAMVRKWSSEGKSGNEKHNLPFLETNKKEIRGVSHIDLMHNKQVYAAIQDWLS